MVAKIVPEKFPAHFWSRVNKGDTAACWEWTASRRASGYGQQRYNGKYCRTHRIAWELTNGPIPDGLIVCHTCDNQACCNPAHLFLGTHADNSDDKIRKGRARHVWGEQQGGSKLTAEKVVEIRRMLGKGVTQRDVARHFGVHYVTIWAIAHGRSWRSVA